MRHPCATIADGLEAMAALWKAEQPLPSSVTSDLDINRVHAQGWLGGQDAGIRHLEAWIKHLRKVVVNGFPWCDVCKMPAVSNEWDGKCHSTPGSPHGLSPEVDKSGHEVTIKEWHDVPPSELGR